MASVLGAFRGFSELSGILITGLLAGAFSVLALVIAKENRLSELRQAWIDSLRFGPWFICCVCDSDSGLHFHVP